MKALKDANNSSNPSNPKCARAADQQQPADRQPSLHHRLWHRRRAISPDCRTFLSNDTSSLPLSPLPNPLRHRDQAMSPSVPSIISVNTHRSNLDLLQQNMEHFMMPSYIPSQFQQNSMQIRSKFRLKWGRGRHATASTAKSSHQPPFHSPLSRPSFSTRIIPPCYHH